MRLIGEHTAASKSGSKHVHPDNHECEEAHTRLHLYIYTRSNVTQVEKVSSGTCFEKGKHYSLKAKVEDGDGGGEVTTVRSQCDKNTPKS